MFRITEAFVRWIAPVLSFTADEMWGYLPGERVDNVLFATWYDGLAPLPADARVVGERLRQPAAGCATQVAKVLEPMRAAGEIGAALQAEIELRCGVADQNWLAPLADELRFLLISGDVRVVPRCRCEGRDRRVRATDGEDQVRALLAPPRRRRRARSASAAVRTLRVEHRGAGRRPGVVLMTAVKPNALPWLGVSALVLVLDQLTKAWVLASLPEYTAVPVIDGFWNWYRTYNTGAAFSFLADAGGWQKWFFTVLAFAHLAG